MSPVLTLAVVISVAVFNVGGKRLIQLWDDAWSVSRADMICGSPPFSCQASRTRTLTVNKAQQCLGLLSGRRLCRPATGFRAISHVIAYSTFKSEPFGLLGIIYAIIRIAVIRRLHINTYMIFLKFSTFCDLDL